MLETIVGAGLPALTYGVIVQGFPDDSHETLSRLESAIAELCERLKSYKSRTKVRRGTVRHSGTPLMRKTEGRDSYGLRIQS